MLGEEAVGGGWGLEGSRNSTAMECCNFLGHLRQCLRVKHVRHIQRVVWLLSRNLRAITVLELIGILATVSVLELIGILVSVSVWQLINAVSANRRVFQCLTTTPW